MYVSIAKYIVLPVKSVLLIRRYFRRYCFSKDIIVGVVKKQTNKLFSIPTVRNKQVI